tara:strand:- start:42 stop:1694 length:1653 start_codon:yes stop_codon:yes gene_type:complete
MLKQKRLILDNPVTILSIIGAIYLLPSLLLYFVSEDLKFALLVEGFTFYESLKNIWLPSASFLNEGGLFRPIVSTINLVDYSLWGVNAFGYHLTNALVHLINIQLVYHLSLRLFKRVDISFLCSIIFLFHPILAHSVYWISGRTDMVSCSFYLLSLIMTDKYLKGLDIRYFIFSQISFFAALLSKEISITLPLAQVWMIWHYKHDSDQDTSLRPVLARFVAYSALVVALFLSYRLFIFGQSPLTIDDVYNIGGFYHLFINTIKVASFMTIPFGHQSFEMLVYDYKLYLIIVLIPVSIRMIYAVYNHRKDLFKEIMLCALLFISILPLFKLAMRWYMYIPTVFFSFVLANIIYSKWGRGNITRAVILIYLALNIFGGLVNYKIWLENSGVNRELVGQLVDKIEKESTVDTFVILNFPAKINRTATFIAGFEDLISLKISDQNKTVLRPLNIVHQLDMFPTDINHDGDNFIINACESSSYCLLGTDRQRLGLGKLSPGDMIETGVSDIRIEKVNPSGQAVRVSMSMHKEYKKNSTLYFYFNERDRQYKKYTF